MKKMTTDKPAAQTPDKSKKVISETLPDSGTSRQSGQNSRSASQSREIDMIPLRSRQTGRIPPQSRKKSHAQKRTGTASAAGRKGRKSASPERKGRKSASPGRKSRTPASSGRQGRKSSSAKRRRNNLRKGLSLAALIILFILSAILLTSGIRRLIKDMGKDTVPPVITLDHQEGYAVLPWQEYEEEGYSASDDRDGDLTDQVRRTVMEDRICYRVSDKAGNESVLFRDIPYDTSYKEATGEDFPDIDIDDPNAEGKVVYLTFDDGPGACTEELLETLDRYGVHVTFFVTGAAPQYEDMIKKEDAAGHSIGVHTFSHDFEKIYKDEKAFWKDIDQIQEVVQRQTGHPADLMRFAGGSSNAYSSAKLMSRLIKQVPEKGLQYFDWNISSGDGAAEGDMKMVINNITSQLANQETCVVLGHDTKEYTVHAMKYLIPWLLDHGYDIQPLQFDSFPAHHGMSD